MSAAKRVRWECPNGKHPGQLGSTRPPKDATVRYCLECSAESGRLVARVAPALERKRAARAETLTAKRQAKAAVAREARAVRHVVTVLDGDGEPMVLDAYKLLVEAWCSKELGGRRETVPNLVVRRGAGTEVRRRRGRDGISGHAKYGEREIVLTVHPNCGHEWLRAIVMHEAVHKAVGAHATSIRGKRSNWHGDRFRTAYIRTAAELYGPGVMVRNEGACHALDESIARAIRRELAKEQAA